MSYQVIVTPEARAEGHAMPAKVADALIALLRGLAQDPRPQGAKRLKGLNECYRLRKGDYRVVYAVRDEKLLVIVLRGGHRKEVYKDLEETVRRRLKGIA